MVRLAAILVVVFALSATAFAQTAAVAPIDEASSAPPPADTAEQLTKDAPPPLPRLDAFRGITRAWQLFIPAAGYIASEVIGGDHAPRSCSWCDVGAVDQSVRNALVWPVGARSTANVLPWGTLFIPLAYDSRTFFGRSLSEGVTSKQRDHFERMVRHDRARRSGKRQSEDTGAVSTPEIEELLNRRRTERVQDLELVAEAVAVDDAINQIVKDSVARQRPRAHFAPSPTDAAFTGSDANVSFYSGHASNAFAIAVSLYRAHAIRGDTDTAKLATIGLISASATAYLRIAADKHYLSDVLVGAAAGSAVGWMIPALHTLGRTHKATVTPVMSPTERAVFVSIGGK